MEFYALKQKPSLDIQQKMKLVRDYGEAVRKHQMNLNDENNNHRNKDVFFFSAAKVFNSELNISK